MSYRPILREIFDIAMHIIDEQRETDGETITPDTQEYMYRAISIIQTGHAILYPYDPKYKYRGYEGWNAASPYCFRDESTGKIDWDKVYAQDFELDMDLSLGVLPYYLAAQLVANENTELANWCMNQYRQNLQDYRFREDRPIRSEFEKIRTPYGGF